MSDKALSFLEKTKAAWVEAVNHTVGPSKSSALSWKSLPSIVSALKPFLGPNYSHGHLPTGGGMDFIHVESSRERGCLEIRISEHSAYVMRPRSLVLEYIEQAPAESFLLLELDELSALKINDEADEYAASKGVQDLVEIPPDDYRDRSIWDRGFLGYDDAGDEIPLPAGTRLVSRWMRGKVLIVVKGSLWNGTPATYNGVHNTMSAADIRSTIEEALKRRGV